MLGQSYLFCMELLKVVMTLFDPLDARQEMTGHELFRRVKGFKQFCKHIR